MIGYEGTSIYGVTVHKVTLQSRLYQNASRLYQMALWYNLNWYNLLLGITYLV